MSSFVSLFDKFRIVYLISLGVSVILHTLCGALLTIFLSRNLLRALIIGFLAALLGLATAALIGAVPALLISLMYVTLPSDMVLLDALIFGASLGLLITLLNGGVFHSRLA